MTRTSGSANVVSFEKRSGIETTSSTDIKHLAKSSGSTRCKEFHDLLNHQSNYLKWIDTRHEELQSAKDKLTPGGKGPKDSTYRKYRWYAEQQVIFESINAFEVFYKQTFIKLATALRLYIPSENIKGSVDSKILWSIQGKTSVPALIFEHQLYHDLDQIDKVSAMLIGARRYNINSPAAGMAQKNKSLQAIFQVRHTLAHNQGIVTTSDSAKFKIHGYSSSIGEAIDPTKNNFGESIRRALKQEALDYTEWLINASAVYLEKLHNSSGIVLRKQTLIRIQKTIGSTTKLEALPWK